MPHITRPGRAGGIEVKLTYPMQRVVLLDNDSDTTQLVVPPLGSVYAYCPHTRSYRSEALLLLEASRPRTRARSNRRRSRDEPLKRPLDPPRRHSAGLGFSLPWAALEMGSTGRFLGRQGRAGGFKAKWLAPRSSDLLLPRAVVSQIQGKVFPYPALSRLSTASSSYGTPS